MINLRYYSNGIFNQVLSLETLFGLEYRYPKQVRVSHFKTYVPLIRDDIIFNKFLSQDASAPNDIRDLFDIPQINFTCIDEDDLPMGSADHMKYFFSPGKDIKTLDDFASGRTPIISGKDYFFSDGTIAYYSSFFHDREPGLDAVLSQIKPKLEYIEFASIVAKALGEFNGGHIRLTDHKHVVNLNKYPVQEMLEEISTNTLVIATDEPDFSQIPKDAIIIEEFILSNFLEEFCSLGVVNGHSLAFVSNLVLHHSKDFVGTKTSTFSGYIQRNIYKNNPNYTFKFFNDDWSSKSDPLLRELPSSKLYGIID